MSICVFGYPFSAGMAPRLARGFGQAIHGRGHGLRHGGSGGGDGIPCQRGSVKLDGSEIEGLSIDADLGTEVWPQGQRALCVLRILFPLDLDSFPVPWKPSKPASQPAGRQAAKQARKHASMQASERASKLKPTPAPNLTLHKPTPS